MVIFRRWPLTARIVRGSVVQHEYYRPLGHWGSGVGEISEDRVVIVIGRRSFSLREKDINRKCDHVDLTIRRVIKLNHLIECPPAKRRRPSHFMFGIKLLHHHLKYLIIPVASQRVSPGWIWLLSIIAHPGDTALGKLQGLHPSRVPTSKFPIDQEDLPVFCYAIAYDRLSDHVHQLGIKPCEFRLVRVPAWEAGPELSPACSIPFGCSVRSGFVQFVRPIYCRAEIFIGIIWTSDGLRMAYMQRYARWHT
jgi:hypothetical protein